MAGAWNNHSKEEQPPCKLKSFTGNQPSRFNKIQCPRCTKRAASEAAQGDILIKGKVLLFPIYYSLRHDAMRKRRCFKETRYICAGMLLGIRVQIRKYNICTLAHIWCLHNERSLTVS